MRKNLILSALVAFGLTAVNTQVFGDSVTNIVTVALVGQVQQSQVVSSNSTTTNYVSITTNLTLNTKALLKVIAADQGFTLPANAILGMTNNTFVVLNQDKSIFTNVTVMNMNQVMNVGKDSVKVTANAVTETQSGTSVGVISYSGHTMGFSLNYLARESSSAKNAITNGLPVAGSISESFSGSGSGPGGYLGSEMIIKGSMTGSGKGISLPVE